VHAYRVGQCHASCCMSSTAAAVVLDDV